MTSSSAGAPLGRRLRSWPILVAGLVGSWLVLRAHAWEWSVNPQYAYGPLVPLICVSLFYLRWKDRPVPTAAPKSLLFVMATLAVLCCALIGLLQPVYESNQDWRALPALAALSAVGIGWFVLLFAGGLTWLRHFAFPIAFLLIGVPWPVAFETGLMQRLMQANAAICVEVLHWLGKEAIQQGNLILLPSGLLGVEEACSGIRSLQTGLMVALLAGEFFRLGVIWRGSLILLSVGCALAGNVARTVSLSLVAVEGGHAAVEKWHDAAGNSVLFFTIAVLWGTSWIASRRCGAAEVVSGGEPLAPERIRALRPFALIALGFWMSCLALTSAWFAWNLQRQPTREKIWTVSPGSAAAGVKSHPIAQTTLDMLLQPDTALFEEWTDNEDITWYLFYFRWEPSKTAIQSAMTVHDPSNCLVAVGMTLRETLAPRAIHTGGFDILFSRYVFARGREPFHVFHVVESDNPEAQTNQLSAPARIAEAFKGRRNQGLRVLEIAVRGAANIDDAERRLAKMLENRLNSRRP